MTSLREPLPPEGDEDEAQELVRRNPVRLPTYKLERIHCATLNVDYSPPHGTGYARPLSPYRLKQLREDWDNGPGKCVANSVTLSLTEVTDISSNTGLVVGNTTTAVGTGGTGAQSPGLRLPVRDLQRLSRGPVPGVASTRFGPRCQRRLDEPDPRRPARGSFFFAPEAYEGAHDSLGALQLEGAFGFYLRYADKVSRAEVVRVMSASGMWAWHNRAAGIYDHVDVGPRANTYGLAIAEMVNEVLRKNGAKVKDLLPAWENIGLFGSRYREVNFRERGYQQYWTSVGSQGKGLAPQHLGVA